MLSLQQSHYWSTSLWPSKEIPQNRLSRRLPPASLAAGTTLIYFPALKSHYLLTS